MQADDPFHLARFLEAQEDIFPQVRAELAAGQKRTHWMWFIFPQVAGLGSSSMAQRFAIASLDEAVAYLQHPVLGPRLRECTELVLRARGKSVEAIFGYPDDLKFHSSATLFLHAAEHAQLAPEVFARVLRELFGGTQDRKTLNLLRLTT